MNFRRLRDAIAGASIAAIVASLSFAPEAVAQQFATEPLNPQTGTTYTVVTGDCGKLVTLNNAAAVAVTLPQATATTFYAGCQIDYANVGLGNAGTVTITPATSTIDGQTSYALAPGQAITTVSDGVNYQVKRSAPGTAGRVALSQPIRPSGIIFATIASTSNATGTSLQTLASFTIPANALDVPGRALRIKGSFLAGATGNGKTMQIRVGSSTFAWGTPLNNQTVAFDFTVKETAANSQVIFGQMVAPNGGTASMQTFSSATSFVQANPLIVAAEATDNTSAAGDISLPDLTVEYLN